MTDIYIDKTQYSHSTEETENIGKSLALALLGDAKLPNFVALYGDLGVGKTAFVRGFTQAIAPFAKVKSPTFALVREYKGEYHYVFHFDMYRITDDDELYSIGFYDYFQRKGFIITEWSENIEYALPLEYISVNISKVTDENQRLIEIKLLKREGNTQG
jgi:tRNA threonylcarbamoyladenosine biosynthesis protein TsaE